VIAELIILIRMVFIHLPEDQKYVHYVAYSTFFSLFVSSGISGGTESIMMFCMVLYAADAAKHREEEAPASAQAEGITG
jgi:hypothetical protein